jgi:chemotaxis protein CheC
MSLLSELQRDALIEIFNIGTGRAAASLSQIVDQEITLSVPHIQFVSTSEINAKLLSLDSLSLSMVEQTFSGLFDIKATLLFTEDSTLKIVRDMMGSLLNLEELAEYEQEALCELGNIILNACMSATSGMLGITLNSSLPTYSMGTSEEVVQLLSVGTSQPMMMVLHINLIIEKYPTQGSLIFVLSALSFQKLLAHVDQFIASI